MNVVSGRMDEFQKQVKFEGQDLDQIRPVTNSGRQQLPRRNADKLSMNLFSFKPAITQGQQLGTEITRITAPA
jgi:hypothetical protein